MYWVRSLVAALWLVSIVPSLASASPVYSSTLRRVFELPCDPTCLLCHTRPEGGFATTNTKFGITLRKRFDAVCCDATGLEAILARLEQAQVDSDGDGVTDVDELRAMSDPNLPDGPGAGDAGAELAPDGSDGAGDAGSELACQPPAASDACSVAPGDRSGVAPWGLLWLGCALIALCSRRNRRAA